MTSTHTTNIPAAIVRRVQRAAKTRRDMPSTDNCLRAQGFIDGILYAVEAMRCDADEIDALYDTIDAILTGGES